MNPTDFESVFQFFTLPYRIQATIAAEREKVETVECQDCGEIYEKGVDTWVEQVGRCERCRYAKGD